MTPPKSMTVDERFDALWQPEPNSGCMIWMGASRGNGYGAFWDGKKDVAAHRFAWERKHGPIPVGLVVDHLCRVRTCVNPAHLRVVTQRENVFENSFALAAINAAKTHCKRGHEFTTENTMRTSKGRECRLCNRMLQTKYREQKRSVRA